MFRLINKSAIWHLCQCVNNWLWNSSKWPFTGAVLQSASQHPRTLGQPSRVSVTPARDGWPRVRGRLVGRLVGRSVGGIKFLTLFRCADSFTWRTCILSSGQR